MNHSDVQSRMADYLDGELALDERALFDAHLDGCDRCSGDLSELQQTVSLLRALPTPQTPPDLAENVIARIRSGEGRSAWQEFTDSVAAWLSPSRLVLPATAVAAAAGVFLISGGQLPKDLRTAPTPRPAAPSAQLADARGAAEVRTAAPTREQAAKEAVAAERARATQPEPMQIAAAPTVPEPEPLPAHAMRSDPVATSSGVFQPSGFTARSRPVVGSTGGGVQSAQGMASSTPAESAETAPREQMLRALVQQLRTSPRQFSAFLGARTPVEREIWMTHLARFTSEEGTADSVLRSMRSSDDPRIQSAAGYFEAALVADSGEVPPIR